MSSGFHSRWWRGTAAERGAFSTTGLYTPFHWFETDTGDLWYWDGSAWAQIAGSNAVPAPTAQGDMLAANATPVWARLPLGAVGKILISDGTDPGWSTGALTFGGASSALTLPNAAIALAGGGASCTLTLPNAGTTITGGGTLALGSYTATIPATCTVAGRALANTFTAKQTITTSSTDAANYTIQTLQTTTTFTQTQHLAHYYYGHYLTINSTPTAHNTTTLTGFTLITQSQVLSGGTLSNLFALDATAQSTAASTGITTNIYTLNFGAHHRGSGTASTVCGFFGGAFLWSNAGNVTTLLGGYAYVGNYSTTGSTASIGRAYYAASPAGTGAITTNTGFHAANMGRANVTTSAAFYSSAQSGAATSWTMYAEGGDSYHEGRLGIGQATIAAKLHVDQSSTTAAIPTLLLDQADLSEEFIEFTTTVGAGNPIDTAAVGTYYGKARVSVTGVGAKFVALYNS